MAYPRRSFASLRTTIPLRENNQCSGRQSTRHPEQKRRTSRLLTVACHRRAFASLRTTIPLRENNQCSGRQSTRHPEQKRRTSRLLAVAYPRRSFASLRTTIPLSGGQSTLRTTIPLRENNQCSGRQSTRHPEQREGPPDSWQ